MFNQVKEYVSKMRDLGYSEDKIKVELSNAGWSEAVINDALNNTDVTTPMAPSPGNPAVVLRKSSNDLQTHNSLMIGFLYVLNFITLWIGSISFILAVHSLIDKAFPKYDQYSSYYPSTSGVDYALNGYIAALLVTTPIFLFLLIYLKKLVIKNPEFRLFKSRKFLIIVTLIAAFLTIVIDLISVITNFLNGDISVGFVLKVFTIILVLGPIFAYYYHDITTDKKHLN